MGTDAENQPELKDTECGTNPRAGLDLPPVATRRRDQRAAAGDAYSAAVFSSSPPAKEALSRFERFLATRPPLHGAKPWYLSRTIVAMVILVIVNVLGRLGMILDVAEIDRAADLALTIITSLLALVGIWGRTVATKQIGAQK